MAFFKMVFPSKLAQLAFATFFILVVLVAMYSVGKHGYVCINVIGFDLSINCHITPGGKQLSRNTHLPHAPSPSEWRPSCITDQRNAIRCEAIADNLRQDLSNCRAQAENARIEALQKEAVINELRAEKRKRQKETSRQKVLKLSELARRTAESGIVGGEGLGGHIDTVKQRQICIPLLHAADKDIKRMVAGAVSLDGHTPQKITIVPRDSCGSDLCIVVPHSLKPKQLTVCAAGYRCSSREILSGSIHFRSGVRGASHPFCFGADNECRTQLRPCYKKAQIQ